MSNGDDNNIEVPQEDFGELVGELYVRSVKEAYGGTLGKDIETLKEASTDRTFNKPLTQEELDRLLPPRTDTLDVSDQYRSVGDLFHQFTYRNTDSFWGFLVGIITESLGWLFGIMTPIMELSNLWWHSRTKSVLLSPDSYIQYGFRTDDWNTVNQYLGLTGLSDYSINVQKEILRPLPDEDMIARLRWSEGFSDTDIDRIWSAYGWDVNKYRSVLQERIHHRLSPEVYWRAELHSFIHGISEEQFRGRIESILRKKGFSTEDLSAIRTSALSILTPYESGQLWLRGKITDQQYRDYLHAAGYFEPFVDQLQELNWNMPTPSDLITFMVREVFTPEVAEKFGQFEEFDDLYPRAERWANAAGLNRETLRLYWAAHWDLPSPSQGYEMFHRGLISEDELKMLMKSLDIMPFWRDRLLKMSYNLIPRRVVRQLLREGVWDIFRAAQEYRKLGYTLDDAVSMAQLDLILATRQTLSITKTELVYARSQGLINRQMVSTILDKMGIKGLWNAFHTEIIERKALRKREVASRSRSYGGTDKFRDLTKNEIIRAYKRGLFDRTEATVKLQSLGYAEDVIEFLLTTADYEVLQSHAELRKKHVRELYLADAIDEASAISQLIKFGFHDVEAQRIVEDWQIEKQTNEDLRSRRGRTPPRTVCDRWLNDGLITVDKWVEYYQRMGYSDDTIYYFLTDLVMKRQGG